MTKTTEGLHVKKTLRGERGDYEIAATLILLGIILVVGLIWGITKNSHRETMQCKVEDKDRTRNSDGGSDMRVYTEECGVLQVKDSMFAGQFDSSDVYSQIKPGKTYEFTTTGWRVPFLSMFPNIVEVEEVTA